MDVLIVTMGSLGDLLPFLAISKALTRRGHRVSIATNGEFAHHVRRLGFHFDPLYATADLDLPTEDVRLWDPMKTWSIGWERVLAPVMSTTYSLIREKARSGKCVVLAHWQAFGARLANEALGVPLCTAYLAPDPLNLCGPPGARPTPWGRSSEDALFGPLLNAYREKLGLGPVDHICSRWMHSPDLGLALFPEWFCPREPYWPAQVETSGFVLFDEPVMNAPHERVDHFLAAGAPPIAFTPGTGVGQAAHFFRESLAACAAMNMRAILLTPHSAQLPLYLPPWTLHVDYIPLDRLLGSVAALVYHGGIGTCAQAIRAGVPQLVMPMASDQFDNAQRVKSLGLGLTIPMKDFEAKAIVRKLNELLGSTSTREAARTYAAKLAADDGLDVACSILERLA